jgi:hypothetical protein
MAVEIVTMLVNFGVYSALDAYPVALSLSFINCVINPVIYAAQMENFKKTFAKYICPFRCARVVPQNGMPTSHSLRLSNGMQSNEASLRN